MARVRRLQPPLLDPTRTAGKVFSPFDEWTAKNDGKEENPRCRTEKRNLDTPEKEKHRPVHGNSSGAGAIKLNPSTCLTS